MWVGYTMKDWLQAAAQIGTNGRGGALRNAAGSIFGDPILATAIQDRLLHHSKAIHIPGEGLPAENRQEIVPYGQRAQRALGYLSFA